MKIVFKGSLLLSLTMLVAVSFGNTPQERKVVQQLSQVLSGGIQHKSSAWTRYPTTLPSAFVEAADFMFENGLADPRGGEYRQIAVTFKSSILNEEERVQTRGWVFTDESTGLMYAVCWDGLVYDVDWVGRELRVESDFNLRAGVLLPFQTVQTPRTDNGYPEFTTDSIIAAAMLYRLGIEYQALKIMEGHARNEAIDYWRKLSEQVVTRQFHRGVSLFLSGDDKAAFRDLDAATSIKSALESFILSYTDLEQGGIIPFSKIYNLEKLRNELADKIQNPRYVERDYAKIKALPRKERILQLLLNSQKYLNIEASAPKDFTGEDFDFEEVLSRQLGAPTDPEKLWVHRLALSLAISAEGEESVPDLLDIAREQKYAVRQVSVPMIMNSAAQSSVIARNVYFASDTAASLAQFYIRPAYTEDLSPGGSQYDQWEAFWNRYRSVPVPQRFVQILGEKDRSLEAWLDAVNQLAMAWGRDDEHRLVHRDFLTDKTVSAILNAINDRLEAALDADNIKLHQMMTLAWAAYRLDPFLAKFALTAPVEHMVEKRERHPNSTFGSTDYDVHEITVLRIQIGDPNAVSDYIKIFGMFARDLGPGPGRLDLSSRHLPVVLFPDVPEFKSFMSNSFDIFRESVQQKETFLRGDVSELTPFLASQELRPAIVEMLEETTVSGHVTVETQDGGDKPNPDGTFNITVRKHAGERSYRNFIQVSKEDLKYIGTNHELRTMDWVAHGLSKAKIGPSFELYWELEKRNEIIEQYKKLVMIAKFDIKSIPGPNSNAWWVSDKPVLLRQRRVRP